MYQCGLLVDKRWKPKVSCSGYNCWSFNWHADRYQPSGIKWSKKASLNNYGYGFIKFLDFKNVPAIVLAVDWPRSSIPSSLPESFSPPRQVKNKVPLHCNNILPETIIDYLWIYVCAELSILTVLIRAHTKTIHQCPTGALRKWKWWQEFKIKCGLRILTFPKQRTITKDISLNQHCSEFREPQTQTWTKFTETQLYSPACVFL